MKLLPQSLFGRNVLLIVGLVLIGQLSAALVFIQAVQKPRLAEMAAVTAAQVKALGIALAGLPPAQRAHYVQELNALDSVQIDRNARPEPGMRAPRMIRYFMRELAGHLGSNADVVWQPRPQARIWVRVPVAGESYWLQLSGRRIRPPRNGLWLGLSLLFSTLALLGAYALQRRLNRPLRELAEAAERMGSGVRPAPLPENVPTELVPVARSFNAMTRNLARQDEERAVMLAGVSHDLRTPLTKLRLGLALLPASVDDDTHDTMTRHIEDMDAIIQQFMDFARSNGDEAMVSGDLNACVRELAVEFAAQGTVFELALQPLPPLRYRPVAMRRLLTNLLHNAAHYAATGLMVTTAQARGRIEIQVLDRGPGVPADQLERLKQPFVRLQEARSGKPGAGLGLAIVERIARLHDGEFYLRLREGGGLAAVVSIPAN